MKTRVILVFELCCFCIVGCRKTSAPGTETNPQPPENDKTAYQAKSSTEWISALKSPDPNTRLKTIRSLYYSCFNGPPQRHKYAKNRDMVNAVRQALNDPSAEIREWADSTLKFLPHEYVLTVDELIEVLRQEETVPETHLLEEKRCYFEVLLISIYVPMVFKDSTLSVRDSVYLVARFEAAQYLGRKASGKPIRALPLLVQLRNDKDPAVRFHSFVAVWKILPDITSPVPLLEKSLKDKDKEVRFWAAHALVEAVGSDAKAAIPVLLDACGDSFYDAFATLLKIGPEIMPEFLAKLELPYDNSADAVFDIMYMTLGEDLSVDYLAVALNDKRPAVRLKALELLGFFSTSAEKIVPTLAQMSETDKDPNMRRKALNVFHSASLDHKAQVPILARALKDTDWRVRRTAAWALGNCLSYGARNASLPLFEALKDPNESVRSAACGALEKNEY